MACESLCIYSTSLEKRRYCTDADRREEGLIYSIGIAAINTNYMYELPLFTVRCFLIHSIEYHCHCMQSYVDDAPPKVKTLCSYSCTVVFGSVATNLSYMHCWCTECHGHRARPHHNLVCNCLCFQALAVLLQLSLLEDAVFPNSDCMSTTSSSFNIKVGIARE